MRSYEGYLEERYFEVASALVAAIRAEDPSRMIIADGINIGQIPVPEFIPLRLVQSTRGYQPKAISHYRATWVPLDEYETMKLPTWPLTDDKGTVWDRARLAKEYLDPWRALIAQGVQIHVGEWGCYNQTPHNVGLPGCPTVSPPGARWAGETHFGICAAHSAFSTASATTSLTRISKDTNWIANCWSCCGQLSFRLGLQDGSSCIHPRPAYLSKSDSDPH